MASNFELFKQQLDDAVALIEENSDTESAFANALINLDSAIDTQSLLARCEAITKKYEVSKPTIRIIHHLACSGGTLISKCISAMPNVYLLSEVHPYTDLALGNSKPKYAPSDISSLTKYAGVPQQRSLAAKLFKSAIDDVYEHVTKYGGTLVLRDHTHADFNTDSPIPQTSSLIELLEDSYDVKSVLTIRNPIDAYASLVKNNWVHFTPQTFDEYCKRMLCLLDKFKDKKVYIYDELVNDPISVMQQIVSELDLKFDDTFEDVFDIFKVTGDSGRSSNIISPRERATLSADYLEEIKSSKAYDELNTVFNFD